MRGKHKKYGNCRNARANNKHKPKALIINIKASFVGNCRNVSANIPTHNQVQGKTSFSILRTRNWQMPVKGGTYIFFIIKISQTSQNTIVMFILTSQTLQKLFKLSIYSIIRQCSHDLHNRNRRQIYINLSRILRACNYYTQNSEGAPLYKSQRWNLLSDTSKKRTTALVSTSTWKVNFTRIRGGTSNDGTASRKYIRRTE